MSDLTMAELTRRRKDGQLMGFKCASCGRVWASPMARCPTDGGTELSEVELPARGKVITFTIQNVAPEEFMNETPYAWAVIELDDGTRVTGWIPYIASDRDLAIGDAVEYTPTYKPGIMFEKA